MRVAESEAKYVTVVKVMPHGRFRYVMPDIFSILRWLRNSTFQSVGSKDGKQINKIIRNCTLDDPRTPVRRGLGSIFTQTLIGARRIRHNSSVVPEVRRIGWPV